MVVLKGENAARISRSYFLGVYPTLSRGRQGRQKNLVFPGIFQCFVFVTYCFRYYFALSLVLLWPFFTQEN